MLEILRDIWERLFVHEPLPESLAQVMDDAARKFPNDRVLVRWRAEFELERRQDLGLRKHDA